MRRDHCPVCKMPAETGRLGTRDALRVRCPRCGPFVLTGTAVAMLPSRLEAEPLAVARTSHAIRSQTSEDNWLEIDSTGVDALTAQPLPAPERQLANLLAWLRARAGDTSLSAIDITNRDGIAAIVGAVDEPALERLLQWATKEGLVDVVQSGQEAALTRKGWEDGPQREAERAEMPKSERKAEIVKGHCPQCGPDRRADIVAAHYKRWDSDDESLWSIDTYNIFQCRGCDTLYVQHSYVFSEDEDYERNPVTGEDESVLRPRIEYWPAPARRDQPDWLDEIKDETLRNLLDEVYGALDADLRVLAAIGARTALDRAMVLKGATEAFGFAEKLDELKDSGLISEHELHILVILTDASGAAAHRGWRPTAENLSMIMDGTEVFLHRALVLGDAFSAMKGDVLGRLPVSRKYTLIRSGSLRSYETTVEP